MLSPRFPRFPALFALLVVLASLMGARAEAAPPRPFAIGPRPAWVEAIDFDPAATIPESDGHGGSILLLSDSQVSIVENVQHYVHVARKILAIDEPSVSTIAIQFLATQSLTIHGVHIHRDGKVLDALVPDEVQIAPRAKDLDHKVYDSALVAQVFAKDLRAGEAIDPIDMKVTIRVHTASGTPFQFGDELVGVAMRYRWSVEIAPAQTTVDFRLTTRTPSLDPADVKDHLEKLDKVRLTLAYDIEEPSDGVAPPEEAPPSFEHTSAILIGLGVITVLVIIARLPWFTRGMAFRRRQYLARGDAAKTAIRVTCIEDATRHLAAAKCGCGRAHELPPADTWQRVHFGGRAITAVRLSCSACHRERSVFFEIPEPRAAHESREAAS